MNLRRLLNSILYGPLLLFCPLLLAQDAALEQRTPHQLQASGIAKIDQWTAYVRRTGDATSTLSDLSSADSDLQGSLALFLQKQDLSDAAWSAMKIADIHRLTNQWVKAVSGYQAAIGYAKTANRSDYETKALARLAYAELKAASSSSALDHAREAVRLGEHCGNAAFYFEALDVAAEAELQQQNLVAAAADLDRAIALKDQVSDKQQLYLGFADRGDIYNEIATRCDYKRTYQVCSDALAKAESDYTTAIAITTELGYDFISQLFRQIVKGIDDRRAILQQRQSGDRLAETVNLFNPQKANDVLVSQTFNSSRLNATDLALIEQTDRELRASMTRLQQQGLLVQDLNPVDSYMRGLIQESGGNNEAALTAYLKAVDLLEQDRRTLRDEGERGSFLEDKVKYYEYPAFLYLQRKQYAEAFALFEQSRTRVLADMLASRPLRLRTPNERVLFAKLQTQRATIAAQQKTLFDLTSAGDREQHADQIVRLESSISRDQQQYQALTHRISVETPNLQELASSTPVTLDMVRQAAAAGHYDVLYYVVEDTSLLLWHINGSETQVLNVFLPHAQLARKVKALRESVKPSGDNRPAPFDEKAANELYLFLIQPALPYLKSEHLLIIPQEELATLPFQALHNPETGKYLGETFEVSSAPSATILSTLKSRANIKSGRLLAVADPEQHNAAEEVRSIGALYPGRSRVVALQPVTKAELMPWINNYDLIHLSVHGRFNDKDPLLSFLQFSPTASDDGHLSAAEMFGLPLQRDSLVVLSACESGVVEETHSSEVLGMERSLLYAGAGSLVLSLWQVDAGSTRIWMETFYREAQTKPPATAAKLALLAVKARPEYSHPFFWAPFMMTGK
ncbi:CHAT domain-containing protein [Granulicella arctica]|uniref:CHAT domain-containing protein n=1 Tax=Granulicella arctica TaxID=940613 RepID=UPI0021E082B6|nr:CHAT domain-containing protein [Granulicella arctica]